MEQQAEVEILIHIGAPSRTADDVRYRSLASSYVNFQPADRVQILSQVSPSISDNENRHELDNQENRQNPMQAIPTSSLSSSIFGSFISPQASFRSVIDNAGSPRVCIRPRSDVEPATSAEDIVTSTTQSSWKTLSSVVQDSYPEHPMGIPTLTSPTRVLEHYLQHFDSSSASQGAPSQQPSSHETPRSNPSQKSTHPAPRDRLAASLVPGTPPIVPCTPRCNPFSTEGLSERSSAEECYKDRKRRNNPDVPDSQNEVTSDDIIEETMIESSDPPSAPRADSEPLPNKRHRPNPTTKNSGALLRAVSDMGPRTSANEMPIINVAFFSEHGYTYDSLELRAPDPSTLTTQIEPDSLISQKLKDLARDLDISKRYRPRVKKRDPRPFERGYWFIDCSTWDTGLKPHVWAYLANYIGPGSAGWGIWCKRDPEFRWIRVYCWGLLTAHIYLLLYLATQRKILFTGASWVDGEGIPIIIMETRSLSAKR